jgi:hypothetical protein
VNPETTPNRADVRRADRDVADEAPEILAQGLVAHVGFVIEGQPYVIPFTYHFDPASPGELHGSAQGRALQHFASSAPICVEVTLLDGLVYSKTAFFHSMNYRSVVCFGRARIVEDEAEKRAAFEKLIGRYFKGRSAPRDYASLTAEHLGVTTLVKRRRGGAAPTGRTTRIRTPRVRRAFWIWTVPSPPEPHGGFRPPAGNLGSYSPA